jgi:hypothetical protein
MNNSVLSSTNKPKSSKKLTNPKLKFIGGLPWFTFNGTDTRNGKIIARFEIHRPELNIHNKQKYPKTPFVSQGASKGRAAPSCRREYISQIKSMKNLTPAQKWAEVNKMGCNRNLPMSSFRTY